MDPALNSLANASYEANLSAGVCCLALFSLLGNKVSFPETKIYDSFTDSYFSQQQSNIRPLCVVSPATVEDASTAVSTLTSNATALDANEKSRCNFAIRSGGHSTSTGTSSIDGGVAIDLRGLKSIDISSDHSIASVGVGATWGEVYAMLDPLGLSVAGGRAAQVGVGGLTIGGGISYFSPRYGWTCDTVSNFEVVLANGTIVNANVEQNPDLLVALRGGSSNFGIVTRVDLSTFEQGPIWGGAVYHSTETADQNLKAFADFNSADYDEYASLIMSFGLASGKGTAFLNNIEYTKAEEKPSVFQPLMEIPSLFSTMRIASMADISAEQGSYQLVGKRQMSVVTTYVSSLPILNATYTRWNSSLEAIEDIPGIVWPITLEPLPPAIYARKNSNNAFGLSKDSGSLVVALLSATWDNEADDATVEKVARELFSGIEEDAHRLGVYEPFLYLNYAAPWQDPINSYGSKSVERLKRVSRDVDPNGVFQHNVPGGLKIWRN